MAGRDSLRDTFFQECEDLLEVMWDGFSRMEGAPDDPETINAVFRAVHSIKGGAGAFGFEALVRFSHALEDVLDDLRNGKLEDTTGLMPLLFRAGDRLLDLVEAERSAVPFDDTAGDHKSLLAELAAVRGVTVSADRDDGPQDDDDGGFVPMTLTLMPLEPLGDSAGAPSNSGPWRLRMTPNRNLYTSGNDPIALLRALRELGELQVTAHTSALPSWDEAQWDGAYLSWSLVLDATASRAEILEVFEFVAEDARLEFIDDNGTAVPAHEEPAAPPVAADAEPGAQTAAAPPATRDAPKAPAGPRPVAPRDASPARAAAPEQRQSIRVDLERVDRLINLVGELVISEAMLSQSLSQSGAGQHPAVVTSLGQLKQLSTELQERIMAIRAQSIKPLFQRMSRIVREAAAASGCEVRLVTDGEATEVDKTVIERLADPLTHMLRNAVDHGIEAPKVREAAGKPRTGTVLLSAAHRSGQVIIEIVDDGAGIDTERVLAKAVERGLVAPDTELSEQEIFGLLFEPGFSTAEQISDLSGRGVGMDVVRSEIKALGGRVTLSSVRGRGTTATISLPLTLAVVEGMLVEVAGETLVVPSTALRETMRASDAAIHRMGAGGPVLSMRGELIPLVDLGATLGYSGRTDDTDGRSLLLVESSGNRRAALSVDRILGQREVVIKGLSENYGQVPGIAAATILGDGSIALIVDVDQVARADGGVGMSDAPSLHPMMSAAGAR
ncbi:MAG: chemotaxis protein CheA [Alkalilacustris sp.]